MNYEIKSKTTIILIGGVAYAIGLALFYMAQL
jgi:hypothetical protein